MCHYYISTCGNSTVFEPPTSVCQDVCEYLWNLCPDQFQQLALHFLRNANVLTPAGLTMINCSNTGDYISPLQHSCSDLDIKIREFWLQPQSFISSYLLTHPACTKVNDSDLVPDPECKRTQTVEMPSASPSTQTPRTQNQGNYHANTCSADYHNFKPNICVKSVCQT